MNFSTADIIVWALGIGLEVAVIFVVRPIWRTFPAFAAYCLYCFLRSLTLFTLYMSGMEVAYFFCYWAGVFFGMILMLLVAREFLAHAMRPWFSIPSDFWGGALLLLICAGLAGAIMAGMTAETFPYAVMTVVKGMQRIVVFVLVAVFGWLLIFPRSIRTPWVSPGHWVVLGFVVSQAGQALGILVSTPIVGKIAFLGAQLIWVGSLKGGAGELRLDHRHSPLPYEISR